MDSKGIARILLEKDVVKLNFKEPFRFVSGILSPIYEDDRQLISFPKERDVIVDSMVEKCKGLSFAYVAGVSTAGIPWAAWLADRLGKPMLYVRPKPKKHGRGRQVEGVLEQGKTVLVIEAMISTGGSLLGVVDAIENEGGKVRDIIIIYTHEIKGAKEKFDERNLNLYNLTEFSTVVPVAREMGRITEEEMQRILDWNQDTKGWGRRHGFE